MEVAPGIHRIELESEITSVAIYALLGEAVTLVDAGFAGTMPQIDVYLGRYGRALSQVRTCVITHAHADHFGGCADLMARAPAVEIEAHPDDIAWVEDPARHMRENYEWAGAHGLTQPDFVFRGISSMLGGGVRVSRSLREGDTVSAGRDWNLRIVETPGHSRGHIALLDVRSGSLLAGDAVHQPGRHPPFYFDGDVYRTTLRRIRALDAQRLLGCHYPVREGPAVAQFIDSAAVQLDECAEIVRAAFLDARLPLGLADVASALLAGTGVGEEARRWAWAAQGHVASLERTGRIRRRDRDGLAAWEMSDDAGR
jgi:glyoxylase-like metal-dependent hydrolase (beta-lactamase superfamily II)